MREKKRNHAGIFCEGCAMAHGQLFFFSTHDHGVENRKVEKQEKRRDPRVHGYRRAKRQDGAAEIQGIARIGIGASHSQNFLFVQIAGGVSAQAKTSQTNKPTEQDAPRLRARKPEHHSGQGIAEANTPTHKEAARFAHCRASICLQTASKTVATSSCSKEGSGRSPRL